MNKLSHYDSSGQPAHGGCLRQGGDAAHGARARVRADRSRGAGRRLPENPKGNPLEIARIAGITAAKRTCDLIPLCHPLMLSHADVRGDAGDGAACAS